MFRRLIFALLLACLALPATATMPCHDGRGQAVTAMKAAESHAAPMPHHRDPATAAHVCIGCVPPSSWRAAPDLAPPLLAEAPPVAALARLDPGRGAPPATPPPRRDA